MAASTNAYEIMNCLELSNCRKSSTCKKGVIYKYKTKWLPEKPTLSSLADR